MPLDVGRLRRARADMRLDLPDDWSPTRTSSGRGTSWETPSNCRSPRVSLTSFIMIPISVKSGCGKFLAVGPCD
jgi:hypothetical protein